MKNLIFTLVAIFAVYTLQAQETSKTTKKSSQQYEMIKYHENGQVAEQGTFNKEGKLHGGWTQYNELGQILVQGTFKDGMKVGKWLFWSDSKLKEVDFKANKLTHYTEWNKVDYLASH